MQKSLTLRDGRKVVLNTPEEEAQISAGIAADPDSYEMTDAEFDQLRPMRGRPPVAAKRPVVSMRLDPDVVAHLRASGKGWQTRAAEVLKDAVAKGRL